MILHALSRKQLLPLLLLALPALSFAQQTIPLNDLSYWQANPKTSWKIVGDATADLLKDNELAVSPGSGVLVNLPDKKTHADLLSAAEFGDVEVSFDFMMATHSNSGFYLMGRYEIQLLDSWGAKTPRYGDCGGIYARRRFDPEEHMYEGHPPYLNASTAPGLWQHMDIAFQAPRFDASGKKVANAKVLKVMLNGITIHENVELTGPTGGPISETEAAKGPFMIQGDHGPVAFRNFVVQDRSGDAPKMSAFTYKVYNGNFRQQSAFRSLKPDLEGSSDFLTWEVTHLNDGFAVVYNSTLDVVKAGKHRFILQAGGTTQLLVNGKELLPDVWTFSADKREAEVDLPAGKVPVEIVYYKMDGWMPPMMALWVEGAGAKRAGFHNLSSTLAMTPADPIFMDAKEPTVFRSFVDFSKNGKFQKRIVHAVNVGDPNMLHYTYDLDNGAIAQIWKGDFLNTSPMWDNRGDGSSRPRGAILAMYDVPQVASTANISSLNDQPDAAAGYRPLGYDLDAAGLPTFRYQINGMNVEDKSQVMEGKYLSRSLTFSNVPAGGNLVYRIAAGQNISAVGNDTWAVDKQFYIRFPKGATPVLTKAGDMTIMSVPVQAAVNYSILW